MDFLFFINVTPEKSKPVYEFRKINKIQKTNYFQNQNTRNVRHVAIKDKTHKRREISIDIRKHISSRENNTYTTYRNYSTGKRVKKYSLVNSDYNKHQTSMKTRERPKQEIKNLNLYSKNNKDTLERETRNKVYIAPNSQKHIKRYSQTLVYNRYSKGYSSSIQKIPERKVVSIKKIDLSNSNRVTSNKIIKKSNVAIQRREYSAQRYNVTRRNLNQYANKRISHKVYSEKRKINPSKRIKTKYKRKTKPNIYETSSDRRVYKDHTLFGLNYRNKVRNIYK